MVNLKQWKFVYYEISAQKNGKYYSFQLLHFSKNDLQNISISFFYTLGFVVKLSKSQLLE